MIPDRSDYAPQPMHAILLVGLSNAVAIAAPKKPPPPARLAAVDSAFQSFDFGQALQRVADAERQAVFTRQAREQATIANVFFASAESWRRPER